MNKFKDILAIIILCIAAIGFLYITWPIIPLLVLVWGAIFWAINRVMYWPRSR
jgi:hypothetical protein